MTLDTLDESRRALVTKLLQNCGLFGLNMQSFLSSASFVPQNDGGMGSFSIFADQERKGTKDCAEAIYYDTDGTRVVIALIVDEDNYPTDVDFWKVDNSPLIRFPSVSDLEETK